MAAKKTILIVDDHPLFREGLKSLIARNPTFAVVGEAGKASEALSMAAALHPDLAIVDISLPDRSGIELTREISAIHPTTRVLIVSMHAKIDTITEAFRAGAAGYVVKDSAAEKVVEGLDAVSRGEYFLDSSLSQSVVKRLVTFPEKAARITDRGYNTLTSREQEVMRLLAEGLTPREIGARLFISTKTVENHRFSIMNKLDLHSSIELVRYAARLGLIDVDRWKD